MADPLLQSLAGARLTRRLAAVGLAWYARHRVGYLDRHSAARLQRAALLRLVRDARHTRFGQEHGFASIRTVADYQERVPPRDYEAFWNDYWKGPFPFLDDVTWPGPIPYFALSSGTTSGTTKHIPISPRMLKSNHRAATNLLAFLLAAHPATPLLNGQVFFLGGSTNLQDLGAKAGGQAGKVLAGDLSGIIAREFWNVGRPYTFPPLELALIKDWETKMRLLAQHSARLPITLVGGVPSWLLVLFEHLRQVTGKESVAEIWPTLRVIVHGGTKFDPYRALFDQLIGGANVRYLETYAASEGFIATEDPRHQMLRLIPDNDLFFEFVPVEDLGKDRPARHTIGNVEPGVQYAVLLTTCAGLWSYVIGDTVCFLSREPPLFRFTGRTKYFLSAFGEHLISEEVEQAVARAAEETRATVVDFHVGPIFPTSQAAPGHHRYLVEFACPPRDGSRFATALDAALCQINEDYQAHRSGDLTMRPPEVRRVPPGGFAGWLRARGQLGGQHKVPRMDNSGKLTLELSRWLEERTPG
jgi:hypothetical protein